MYITFLCQILLFLKGFTEDQRNKLAIVTGIILANGKIFFQRSMFILLDKEPGFLCDKWVLRSNSLEDFSVTVNFISSREKQSVAY